MPFTPDTTFLAITPAALRATVAASARFQALVGAAGDSAVAALRCHLQLVDDSLEDGHPDDDPKLKDPRPRAWINTVEDFTLERQGPGEWQPKQTLQVNFELVIPEQYRATRNDQYLWFVSQIGTIIDQMIAARDADTAGTYLPFDRIECVTDPMPCLDDLNSEDFWGATYAFFSQ